MEDQTYTKKDQAIDRKQADRIEVTTDLIKDIVRDVVLESHQSITEVQSNTLAEVQKLNGYGRIWRFLRTDLGTLMVVFAFLGLVGSFFNGYYSFKSDFKILNNKVDGITSSVENIQNINSAQTKLINSLDREVATIKGFLLKLGFKL